MSYYTPMPRLTLSKSYVSITMRLADGTDDLLIRHVRLLRDSVALAQARWGFGIDAAVVLPGELQLLCSFADPDFGVRGAIRLISTAFARHVPGEQQYKPYMVWADSTEITEIAPPVLEMRRKFIEDAPVRAGLVKCAEDWPYSSANTNTAQAGAMGVAVA